MVKKFLSIAILFGAMVAGLFIFGVGHAQQTAPSSVAASSATPSSPKPDPSGALTGNVSDVPAAKAGEPTLSELANAVGHNRVAINLVWTLIAGFLVMFMQPGFAMVETGFTRAKNALHTMAMNFMIYPLGMLGFYICGFAFMFGGLGPIATLGGYAGLNHEITVTLFGKQFGLVGGKGFLLSGSAYDVSVFALFLFQMVFMDTTATIPTGAMADGSYGDGWNNVPGTVKGLFSGDPSQFIAQCIGVVSNVVYVGLISLIVFKLIDLLVGSRADAEAEIDGLDIPEMGMLGYSGIHLDKTSETPLSK